MECEDGFFQVTSVHRDDIKKALRLTDDQAAKITDDMMRDIARQMADDYCEQLFWDHLPLIVEHVAEIEGIDLFGKRNNPDTADRRKRFGGNANGKM